METLKRKFIEKALPLAGELKNLVKEHGDVVVGQYTIEQVVSGMRAINGLLTCTSKLDPEEGIRFRGYSIPELQQLLPHLGEDGQPLPEGIFYLMLVNEIPSEKDVHELSCEWAMRGTPPEHAFRAIDALPLTARPMTQFIVGITAMATQSKFAAAYEAGIAKKDYWDPMFEGVMDLISCLPHIAAYIYRRIYHGGKQIASDPSLDWAANFAHMMGYDDEEIRNLFRMYLTIHADHEGGNVSAHTVHLVGSALSNPYYAFAAGMAGLAGPLHGWANQEVIMWILELIEEVGEAACMDKELMAEYIRKTISEGKVVPGYGHAVLRKTDPRFTVQQEFAAKHIGTQNNIINMVNCLYEVVPPILSSLGKIKNPWPNVDAISGSLLMHYGIKEYKFYTVMFGVSRALGVLAQLVWDRAYGLGIERPSSQPMSWFKEKALRAKGVI